MFSVSKIKDSHAAAAYFADKDDYYLAERSGAEWWGTGAHEIGLAGEVDPRTFTDLLDGKVKGQQVYKSGYRVDKKNGKERKVPQHTPGHDATFSAPKSVSFAALVYGDTRLIDAHNASVRVALKALESRIAITRQRAGEGEYTYRFGSGIVAALFLHLSSRDLECQIHTHAVILNILRDLETGGWVSLDTREGIYKLFREAESLYKNELGARVRGCGYDIDWTVNEGGFPNFELRGISQAEIDLFSRRKAAIDAKLAEGGLTREEATRAQRQAATLETRSPKEHVEGAELRRRWLERLMTLGPRERAFVQPEATPRPDPEAAADAAVARAAASISERNARFILPDMLTEARIFSQGHASESELQAAVQRGVEKGDLIATQTLARVPGGDLKPVPGFTTKAGQEIELALLATASRMQHGGSAILSPDDATAAVEAADRDSGGRLTDEHKAALAAILTSESRLEMIQGLAGSAKTSSVLKYVAHIARERGWKVSAMAPTAKAAAKLGVEIGAESRTVASVILSDKKPDGPAGREIWIMDEAGQLGAAAMRKFLDKADAAGAMVLATGDIKQIGAVAAGKPFDQLQQRFPDRVHKLTRILRQRNARLLAAVEAAARGDVAEALGGVDVAEYPVRRPEDDDRPEAIDEARAEARKNAYADVTARYRDQLAQGRNALVVALATADRDAINVTIQAARVQDGEVRDVREMTVLRGKDWTTEQQADAARYRVGDVILARKNVAHIARGKTAEVIAIADGKVTVRNRADGSEWTFNPEQYKSYTAYTAEKITVGVGDRMAVRGDLAGRDDNEEWRTFKNGDTVTVVDRAADGGLVVTDEKGKRYAVASDAPLQADLGYAQTADSAQSATFDASIGCLWSSQTNLADQHRLYVTLSRAQFYSAVVTDDVKLLAERIQKRTGDKETSLTDKTDREGDGRDSAVTLPGYELPPREAGEVRTAGDGNEAERAGDQSDQEQARDPAEGRAAVAGRAPAAGAGTGVSRVEADTDKSHEVDGSDGSSREATAARSADRAQAANEPEPDQRGHQVGFIRDVAHASAAVARPAMARQIQKLRDAIFKSKEEARPTRITRDQAAIASGLALHERYENEDRLWHRSPPSQKDWKAMVKRHGEAVGPDGTRYTQDDNGRVFTNRMLRADRREIVRRDFMDPKQRVQRRIVGKPGDTHVMVSKDHGKSWKRADLFDSLATRYATWRRDRMQQRLELDRLKWQTSGGRETRDSRWLANEALITDERLQKSWFKRKIDWDAMADRNGVAYDKLGYRYTRDDKGRIYGEALTKRGYYVMRSREGREAMNDMRKHASRGNELAHDYEHGEQRHHFVRRAGHAVAYRAARARLEKVIGDGQQRELDRLSALALDPRDRRWREAGRHESRDSSELAAQALRHERWSGFDWDKSARENGVLYDRDGRRYALDEHGFARSEALEKSAYHYRFNAEARDAKRRQAGGSGKGPLAWWAEQRTREKVWNGVKAERARLGRIVETAEKQRAQEAARIRDEVPFGNGATISVPGTKMRVSEPGRDNSRGR